MSRNIDRVNLEKDMQSERSVYRYYQKVLALKKSSRAAICGKPQLYDEKNRKIVCFTRETEEGEGLLVFGNFSNKNVRYSLCPELSGLKWKEILSNYDSHLEKNGQYELRSYEVLVLTAEKPRDKTKIGTEM